MSSRAGFFYSGIARERTEATLGSQRCCTELLLDLATIDSVRKNAVDCAKVRRTCNKRTRPAIGLRPGVLGSRLKNGSVFAARSRKASFVMQNNS